VTTPETVIGVAWLIGMTNAFNTLETWTGSPRTSRRSLRGLRDRRLHGVNPSQPVAVLSIGICFACVAPA